MVLLKTRAEHENGVTQTAERRHSMTADQMKRKFRNFPEAELRRRIAAGRLV
jgi:hypothetical protein